MKPNIKGKIVGFKPYGKNLSDYYLIIEIEKNLVTEYNDKYYLTVITHSNPNPKTNLIEIEKIGNKYCFYIQPQGVLDRETVGKDIFLELSDIRCFNDKLNTIKVDQNDDIICIQP